MNKLSDIVRSAMIGKRQIPGTLKRGDNFCISGLLISHFAPDINIEHDSWSGITQLVRRYPEYFSEDSFSTGAVYGHDAVQKYVNDFKQYYSNTGRINLRILVSINDTSFGNQKPFTFTDFANLFEEIGIKIEQLEPKYKENDVITMDNIKVTENEEKPMFTTPIMNGTPIVNIQLDPEISHLLSQQISKMLIKTSGKV